MDVGRPQSLVDFFDGGPGSGSGTAGRGRTAHVRHTAGHTCITDIVSYAFETQETINTPFTIMHLKGKKLLILH
jgi:hypothetical protein